MDVLPISEGNSSPDDPHYKAYADRAERLGLTPVPEADWDAAHQAHVAAQKMIYGENCYEAVE